MFKAIINTISKWYIYAYIHRKKSVILTNIAEIFKCNSYKCAKHVGITTVLIDIFTIQNATMQYIIQTKDSYGNISVNSVRWDDYMSTQPIKAHQRSFYTKYL